MHFSIPQDTADELDEDVDFTPMPTPASASAAAAALRRAEAERKRDERAARRDAKRPDPRAVDVALGQALTEVLRRNDAANLIAKAGTVEGLRVHMKPVLELAMTTLRDKGTPRHIAAEVLQRRLFPSKGA